MGLAALPDWPLKPLNHDKLDFVTQLGQSYRNLQVLNTRNILKYFQILLAYKTLHDSHNCISSIYKTSFSDAIMLNLSKTVLLLALHVHNVVINYLLKETVNV